MLAGAWRLNGESVKFNKEGEMIDGEHRALAVLKASTVKANISIKSFVTFDLNDEDRATMDSGRARVFSDVLEIEGEKNASRLAGTINILYGYAKKGTFHPLSPPASKHALKEFLEDHPEIRNYMHPPMTSVNNKLLTPSSCSALYYLFSLVDEDDAKEFFTLLAKGDGIGSGHPIYHLRERLQRESDKTHGKIQSFVRAALAIKAWNAWRNGTSLYTLKWTGGGGKAEVFPRIEGCPLVPEVDKVKI